MKNNPEDNQEYVIFASDVREALTAIFLKESEISFMVLDGKYKGTKETSYIINKKQYAFIKPLIRKQESVLFLSTIQDNGKRKATLEFNNGILENLGYMNEVSQDQAEASEAYTKKGNQYFVTGE